MSLFGNNNRSSEKKGGFDFGEALLGFFADPGVMQQRARRREKRAEDEARAQQRQSWRTAAVRLGVPEQDLDFYEANPDELIKAVTEQRFGIQKDDFYTPKADGTPGAWTQAPQKPNNTEQNFQLFGRELGPDAAKDYLRSQANPPRWIEVSDGQGGMRIIPVPSVPSSPTAAPQMPITDDDIRRMMQQGGAGSAVAPRPFR